jgi:hypothetical protein
LHKAHIYAKFHIGHNRVHNMDHQFIQLSNPTIIKLLSIYKHLEDTDWTITQTIVNSIITVEMMADYGNVVIVRTHSNYKGTGPVQAIITIDCFGKTKSNTDFS